MKDATHSHNTEALLQFLNRSGRGETSAAQLLRDMQTKGGKVALAAYHARKGGSMRPRLLDLFCGGGGLLWVTIERGLR